MCYVDGMIEETIKLAKRNLAKTKVDENILLQSWSHSYRCYLYG